MSQETNFEKLDQEMRARVEMAREYARKDDETRLEFVSRVAAMMLRSGENSMYCGDEFLTAHDVANELEQLAFEVQYEQKMALIRENASMLTYAELHADHRTQMVLKSRIDQLVKLK